MNIEESIAFRAHCRTTGQYAIADRVRNDLDRRLVFVFDGKDGEDVYYMTPRSFRFKDRNIETHAMTNRQYVERLIQDDVRANKALDAWIFSNTKR